MNPSVLFVDHAGVLGGAELSLLDIARHYHDSSEVLLFSDGAFRERLEDAGVDVRVLPAPPQVGAVKRESGHLQGVLAIPGVLGLVYRLAKLARRYDVIYANSQKAFVTCALAGKLVGKPVIWHLRDILSEEHFSENHRKLVVWIANRMADRVIANSHATAEAFRENGGRPEKVRVVHNGIDSEPFTDIDHGVVASLRQEIGIPDVPVVGVFSRLAHWKGQHLLLESLPHLPGVHALLVGEVLFGEHEYARELHRRTKALGLEDRVHFLGFREDVPELMSLADVVVHTSLAPEPFGRVIVEGMLAGTPVVASRAGGAVELIEDGTSGRLTKPGDSENLTTVLSQLFADRHLMNDISCSGREWALERFSLKAMIGQVEAQVRATAELSGLS